MQNNTDVLRLQEKAPIYGKKVARGSFSCKQTISQRENTSKIREEMLILEVLLPT